MPSKDWTDWAWANHELRTSRRSSLKFHALCVWLQKGVTARCGFFSVVRGWSRWLLLGVNVIADVFLKDEIEQAVGVVVARCDSGGTAGAVYYRG